MAHLKRTRRTGSAGEINRGARCHHDGGDAGIAIAQIRTGIIRPEGEIGATGGDVRRQLDRTSGPQGEITIDCTRKRRNRDVDV